jgi:hypothetical protein
LLPAFYPAHGPVVRNTIRTDQLANEKHTGNLKRIRNFFGLNEG